MSCSQSEWTTAIRRSTANSARPENLRAAQLLQDLSDSDIHRILARGVVHDVPQNAWLFQQGQPAREMFLLVTGRVRLHQVSAQGEDMLVRFLPPLATCASNAVIPDASHAYSALSVRPTRLVAWQAPVARELIHAYPRFALNLFAVAADLLTSFQERCRQLATQPVARRILWAVGELAGCIGEKTERGILIDDPAMQRDLADLAGTTVYTVSRVLAEMHRRGVLSKGRGRIVVRNYQQLLDPDEPPAL